MLPVQVLLLASVVRLEASPGYALLDLEWFSAIWDSPQLFLGAAAYGAFLLWRGVTATAPLPVPERLHTRFLIGLSVLFFALLFAFFTDNDFDTRRPLLSLGVFGVLYFGVGMAAIAVANLRDIRREMVRRSDTASPPSASGWPCRWPPSGECCSPRWSSRRSSPLTLPGSC